MNDRISTGRYILDDDDQPQPCEDLLTWGAWFEASAKQRQVAIDVIGPYTISTIFLAIDHNLSPINDPLIYTPVLWETMIFGAPPWTEALAQRRYASRSAAEQGHAEFVGIVQAKMDRNEIFSNMRSITLKEKVMSSSEIAERTKAGKFEQPWKVVPCAKGRVKSLVITDAHEKIVPEDAIMERLHDLQYAMSAAEAQVRELEQWREKYFEMERAQSRAIDKIGDLTARRGR
jgi:hypothetical protein